ncbi:MAG: hypothetical protein GY708_24035 [Actinomycetia bacterium]|nr:hypothetical protein [Actinomycetes bacterium]
MAEAVGEPIPFGWAMGAEASTFPRLRTPGGEAHDLGRFYIVIDPTAYDGRGFYDHLSGLGESIAGQEGALIPDNRPTHPSAGSLGLRVRSGLMTEEPDKSDPAAVELPEATLTPTALPSTLARGLALAAIIVAGLCGGLVGWAATDLQCTGDCGTPSMFGAIVGALLAALGVTIIAVLTLRAMAEWNAQAPLRGRPGQ